MIIIIHQGLIASNSIKSDITLCSWLLKLTRYIKWCQLRYSIGIIGSKLRGGHLPPSPPSLSFSYSRSSGLSGFNDPFCPDVQNIITPNQLKLGTWTFDTLFTATCVSCDKCHMSHVTCQVSGVICQVSHVIFNSLTLRARELKFV